MTVRRIVADLAAEDPAAARRFYGDLLGLETVMDLGFIVTFAAPAPSRPQVSVAREGGSGAPVPAISVEVDDVDAYHRRAREAGFEIAYPLTDEPWGMRRFFVRDPAGRLVNVLSHAAGADG
jgi:lactoylglutathione lyase